MQLAGGKNWLSKLLALSLATDFLLMQWLDGSLDGLLPGWVTVRQVNYLYITNTKVNSAFCPFVVGKLITR